jgi:hypothetical protein
MHLSQGQASNQILHRCGDVCSIKIASHIATAVPTPLAPQVIIDVLWLEIDASRVNYTIPKIFK